MGRSKAEGAWALHMGIGEFGVSNCAFKNDSYKDLTVPYLMHLPISYFEKKLINISLPHLSPNQLCIFSFEQAMMLKFEKKGNYKLENCSSIILCTLNDSQKNAPRQSWIVFLNSKQLFSRTKRILGTAVAF